VTATAEPSQATGAKPTILLVHGGLRRRLQLDRRHRPAPAPGVQRRQPARRSRIAGRPLLRRRTDHQRRHRCPQTWSGWSSWRRSRRTPTSGSATSRPPPRTARNQLWLTVRVAAIKPRRLLRLGLTRDHAGWVLTAHAEDDGGLGVSKRGVSLASAIQRGRLTPSTPALRIGHLPSPPAAYRPTASAQTPIAQHPRSAACRHMTLLDLLRTARMLERWSPGVCPRTHVLPGPRLIAHPLRNLGRCARRLPRSWTPAVRQHALAAQLTRRLGNHAMGVSTAICHPSVPSTSW